MLVKWGIHIFLALRFTYPQCVLSVNCSAENIFATLKRLLSFFLYIQHSSPRFTLLTQTYVYNFQELFCKVILKIYLKIHLRFSEILQILGTDSYIWNFIVDVLAKNCYIGKFKWLSKKSAESPKALTFTEFGSLNKSVQYLKQCN